MNQAERGIRARTWQQRFAPSLPLAAALALISSTATLGADARWLSALGRRIVHDGAIPTSIPYASAPSPHWHDVPALAELIFYGIDHGLGERGLLLAQVAAVLVAVGILGAETRRVGAGDGAILSLVLLVIVAGFPSFAVIRVQLFSLALFPLLIALLRRESARPSRRIWLCIPLVAIWSNLHGAVLVGIAVAAAYLLLERIRTEPLTAIVVLTASLAALCATPSLLRTVDYYRGVLSNEAARRGTGLWAPMSLTKPFDVVMILGALVLLALAVRARPPLWEIVAILALAALTLKTSRSGVWLLLFVAVPAATGLGRRLHGLTRVALPIWGAVLAIAVAAVVRGPLSTGADSRLIHEALLLADGTPILAEDVLAEQVAVSGGKIWLGNPLDAFRRSDQAVYLDWLAGRASGDVALRRAGRVVLVHQGSRAEQRLAERGFARLQDRDGNAALYVMQP